MASPLLHDRFARALVTLRRRDGGLPASADGRSEVEPTAVAALALPADAGPRRWLAARQRPDGGFGESDGRTDDPTSAALAALALHHPDARGRALAHAIAHRGLQPPGVPDPERRIGWGWTSDTRSLVEPTSRVLLSVNRLTPANSTVRNEAVGLLADRQCADGGWNFGNPSVYDVDLRGYAQTTAIALIALQGAPKRLVEPGVRFLRHKWRLEPGGLTTAQAVLAFRLHGLDEEVGAALEVLNTIARRPSFVEKPLVVAWATLATGPDALLDPLRSRA